MPRLVMVHRAQRELGRLPVHLRDAVFGTLTDIEADPASAGKPLIGRLADLWSARVGSYRIVYTIEKKQVVVRSIRHRAVV